MFFLRKEKGLFSGHIYALFIPTLGVSTCYVLIFDPAQRNAIQRWCTGRKWHIPMASNRKRSHGRIKAYNMGQGEGPTVPIQTDAPEESDTYFCLMTIKHSISKIQWVIVWALNYYLTQLSSSPRSSCQ